MNFEITSDFTADTKMYPGMLISYKVSPVLGIKMNWVTEITHVKDLEYFIDEQRTGPYAMWHHEHHFKEIKGGVHMTDILTYAIPYGIIGQIANAVLVEKEVKNIFAYREKEINKLFGVYRAGGY
ncbi:SRPBCC family protein [Mucilaginibacter paludis]|nr:SRPBCC family protein [Mucilaginibacter paludis]